MKALDLGKEVRDEFSAHTLRRVGDEILECEEFHNNRLYLLFVRFVCFEVAEEWIGGVPVKTERADLLSEKLGKPMADLLMAVTLQNYSECSRLAEQIAENFTMQYLA